VSLVIRPSRSAASIIAAPIRSLTLDSGLNDSSLAATMPSIPSVTRLRRTKGVPPISLVMSSAIFISKSLYVYIL
jgi:hypothetical protein